MRPRRRGQVLRVLLVGVGLILLWRAFPELWVVWSLTLGNLLLKENFPFSHYPMYARHHPTNHYFFLTDEREEPIPVREFRVGAGTLRKIFNAETRRMRGKGRTIGDLTTEQLAGAGRRTLELLVGASSRTASRHRVVRLHHVDLRYDGGAIRSKTTMIAELEIP